ncbi:hypothetical protein KDA_27080 [Dictyobacter alpinus]|uniref:Uncharacterized protein n=1 Tax=Dictyobacter alpinus TaxID=2014873 RepID=A0A402B789_9CHLR|nr:hypothetical protein KDA_27080 [Dictyobacter alpinus]
MDIKKQGCDDKAQIDGDATQARHTVWLTTGLDPSRQIKPAAKFRDDEDQQIRYYECAKCASQQ